LTVNVRIEEKGTHLEESTLDTFLCRVEPVFSSVTSVGDAQGFGRQFRELQCRLRVERELSSNHAAHCFLALMAFSRPRRIAFGEVIADVLARSVTAATWRNISLVVAG